MLQTTSALRGTEEMDDLPPRLDFEPYCLEGAFGISKGGMEMGRGVTCILSGTNFRWVLSNPQNDVTGRSAEQSGWVSPE
jgi:hypothetical protein